MAEEEAWIKREKKGEEKKGTLCHVCVRSGDSIRHAVY